MLNIIIKIDLLKKAQECINAIPELKEHIKLDLFEEDTGADLNLLIIIDLPWSWELRDKIVYSIYDCLEEFDPYIGKHVNTIS